MQNNQLNYIYPKTFGQLLTDNVIYINIVSNYALTCKELCWLNDDVYKNPNQCIKLLNTGHCRHNNFIAPCWALEHRWFLNRRRDERVSVRKSPNTKILRKTHVKPKGTGGTDTCSDDCYLKPVPSDKCHSSYPEGFDSIERQMGLVKLEIRPPSHVEQVMRISELYERVKAGDHIFIFL